MREGLRNKHVAILATHGFEQSELESPLQALKDAGAQVKIISLKKEPIRGWRDGNWGDEVNVDMTVAEANPDDFDALVLPGGVANPDKLRIDDKAVSFVRTMAEDGKPIAAICHGPWILINAEVVRGRTVTSYYSIRKDLENAGANWVDQSVVVDNGLVTSRKPSDLEDFNRKMIEEIREGQHSKPFFAEDESSLGLL